MRVCLFICRDENYCTAMILAASKGHVKVIHHLIENMAEVNVSDKLKVRPLRQGNLPSRLILVINLKRLLNVSKEWDTTWISCDSLHAWL